MRISNLFFSLIYLLIAGLLLVLGVFIFMIPDAPHFREVALSILSEDPLMLKFFGAGVCFFGFLLVLAFFALNRRHSYRVKMGTHILTIDESIVHSYVSSYWKGLFPNFIPHSEVTVKKELIYLAADLPYVRPDEQKKVLHRIEHDLQRLFTKVFDYRKPFYLTITFQDKP